VAYTENLSLKITGAGYNRVSGSGNSQFDAFTGIAIASR